MGLGRTAHGPAPMLPANSWSSSAVVAAAASSALVACAVSEWWQWQCRGNCTTTAVAPAQVPAAAAASVVRVDGGDGAAGSGKSLRTATTDGVCEWLEKGGFGELVGLFRDGNCTGVDLADLVEPDSHGFSVEQKLMFMGVKEQSQLVALGNALKAEPSLTCTDAGGSGSTAVAAAPAQVPAAAAASAVRVDGGDGAAGSGKSLRTATTDGVCEWLEKGGFGELVGLFRDGNCTGVDLADLVEPDSHGFSVEQKLMFMGVKEQSQLVALGNALKAEPSLSSNV